MNFSQFTKRSNRWIAKISNRNISIYFLIFFLAFFLRLLPEIIIRTYPVGYETITYYAPAMIQFQDCSAVSFIEFLTNFLSTNQPFENTFVAGPFFYLLMFSLVEITGDNSFLILKIVAPVLYGVLALSFYFFSLKSLKFSKKTALLATIFMIFQIATLRISWDRFRTVLALVFFFISLILITKKDSLRNRVFLSGTILLTVLSRDYIGFLLIIVSLGYCLFEKKDFKKVLVISLPSIIVMILILNPVYLNWNYFSQESIFFISNYLWGVQDSLSIFIISFLLILPLVIKGFSKNSILNSMLIWLLLGSFSLIIFPWFSIPGYQRWLMLLVFPFSIYATLGLKKLNFGKYSSKFKIFYMSLILILGISYSLGTFSYVILPNSYIPVNMVQSSIPWNEIDDVKEVLGWFDVNGVTNSTLLCEERFLGWTQIYLKRDTVDVKIKGYIAGGSPLPIIEGIFSRQIYLIWYIDNNYSGFEKLYS
ncbi:MAG: hypothetical protein AC479_07020, partial [miscellaneous Crenarchaeota group-6 archaeon AD8-1]